MLQRLALLLGQRGESLVKDRARDLEGARLESNTVQSLGYLGDRHIAALTHVSDY